MQRSTISQLRRISPQDGAQYFFGYYDVPAFSPNDQLHLAHRVQFWDRLPREDDVAQVGFIERSKNTFTPLAQTTTWNFQQGSMLQWLGDSEEIIFNVRDKGSFGSCILNINTSEKRMYPMPVASVDRQGRYALSVNFSRMFDFRAGYGYAGQVDPWIEQEHPQDDGIYLLDFRDGSVKLILPLQQIWEFTQQWLPEPNRKILVNHITLNPSGTRFVALVRFFPVAGVDLKWKTVVITADVDGGNLRAIKNDYIVASHYHWKNDDELMIYADGELGVQLYEWNERTGEEHAINPTVFLSDGHCNYSPDGKWVLYDSYPDEERYQQLFTYNLADRKVVHMGKLYSYEGANIDIRCDLHPRWNRAGNVISLDSNHEGSRHIYELQVDNHK
jgi:hypothetical protein